MRIIREALKIIGIWVIILLAFALVLEGVLRLCNLDYNPLAEIAQKNPGRLFAANTFFRSRSSVPGEFDYTPHMNRFGYRGSDFNDPKPAGVRRVFMVGDSFTFGVGSPDDKTIPFLVEQGLGHSGKAVEVINAGIGGASPVMHYVNIRDIHLKYQPDAVVLMLDLTDLWDDWNSERHAVMGKDGDIAGFDALAVNGRRDPWVTMTYYSMLCRYINNKVVRTIRKMQVLGVGGYVKAVKAGKRAKAVISTADAGQVQGASIEYDGLLFMRGRAKEALVREHWTRTGRYILKIRDLLARRGISMVIVVYPHGIYVDGDQWKEGRKTWGFEPGKRYDDYLAFEIVEDFARQNHIPYVNTLPAFLKAPRAKYFFDWDGHLTSAGNRIVSDAPLAHKSFLHIFAPSAVSFTQK